MMVHAIRDGGLGGGWRIEDWVCIEARVDLLLIEDTVSRLNSGSYYITSCSHI